MRQFDAAFAAALAADATTFCRCWRVIRRDGAAFGFTDHDRDIVFEGTTFAANTGVAASALESELGLAPGGGEFSGALSDAALLEDDLVAGKWDHAAIESFLVDWRDPSLRFLTDRGQIGEVRRADNAFTVELRGEATAFDAEKGRLFQTGCAAALGDQRCGIDLSSPVYRAEAAVAESDGASFVLTSGLASYAAGWFRAGLLTWLTGANAGREAEIRDDRPEGAERRLEFWMREHRPIAAGDTFRIVAGCDKRLETCKAKFANVSNFQGFPHIPGEAVLARIARQGDSGMDGGSLFS